MGYLLFFFFFFYIISSENRYLLFLTENYAALDILEHYIRGERVESVKKTTAADSQQIAPEGDGAEQKPFTLFGSSFPKDKEYTQVLKKYFSAGIGNSDPFRCTHK